MKSILLTLSVLVIGLLLVSAVYANYHERGYRGICTKDIEKVEKFQKETLPLRDEMITKRFEIRKEYQKENPNLDRIAQLKKEIIDIKTKIHKIANNMGIDFQRCFNRNIDRPCGQHNRQSGYKHRGDW